MIHIGRNKLSLAALAASLLAAVSFVTASAQQPNAPAPAPTPAATPTAPLVSDPEYRLGDGDVIDVAVIGSADFASRARVANDGAVLLPLVGAIQARGETTASLSTKITAALKSGGFFANPVVRVELVGIRRHYATVLGAVTQPGLLPLDRSYRLSEIMARVGASAGAASYVVLTPAQGEAKNYRLSDLATGRASEDPIVQSGDKIYIPPASAEMFYITGAVIRPGPQNLLPNMTVRVALAMAGGVAPNGSEKKVSIVRAGKPLPGAVLDTKLEAGDVVTFGTRLF